jgi:hypothetical protein
MFQDSYILNKQKENTVEITFYTSAPPLLYWSEECTLLKIHERQSETEGMVFLRTGAEYVRSHDYKTHEEILELYTFIYI